MTQPTSPDPTAPADVPGGHPPPAPSFVKPTGPAPQPSWSGGEQLGAGQQGPGPFSPLVGRPLTSDETTWSLVAHLGGIVLGFLAPLVVMLTKGTESRYTRAQSVEALNFQITLTIASVVAAALIVVLIGAVLLPVLYVVNIVFCVLGGIAANKGETYRYPLTVRLVS